MDKNSIKKRLFFVILALAVALAGAGFWLTSQHDKPYQVRTVADSKLYLPAELLGPKPKDLIAMVKEFLLRQTNSVRLQTSAEELLNPASANEYNNDPDNIVIFTVSENSEVGQPQGLTQEDTKLVLALANGEGPSSKKTNNGLLEIHPHDGDESAVSYSNVTVGSQNLPPNPWVAHCIHFRALRQNSSWGRCSREFLHGPFKISMHYDGLLVTKTPQLSAAIQTRIQSWTMQPTN